jgi:hypothetical protein
MRFCVYVWHCITFSLGIMLHFSLGKLAPKGFYHADSVEVFSSHIFPSERGYEGCPHECTKYRFNAGQYLIESWGWLIARKSGGNRNRNAEP